MSLRKLDLAKTIFYLSVGALSNMVILANGDLDAHVVSLVLGSVVKKKSFFFLGGGR